MSQERQGQTIVKEKEEIKTPRMFAVILHNDDYTTMEFVIEILMNFFKHTQPEATALMLQVHEKGKAQVGRFTREVAESKVDKVTRYARKKGHPLKCTFEPCNL